MTPDDPLADTDEQTLRRQRLRDNAERLMSAFESLPPPETYLEAERAARALMAIDRMMAQVYDHAAPVSTASQDHGFESFDRAATKTRPQRARIDAADTYESDDTPVEAMSHAQLQEVILERLERRAQTLAARAARNAMPPTEINRYDAYASSNDYGFKPP